MSLIENGTEDICKYIAEKDNIDLAFDEDYSQWDIKYYGLKFYLDTLDKKTDHDILAEGYLCELFRSILQKRYDSVCAEHDFMDKLEDKLAANSVLKEIKKSISKCDKYIELKNHIENETVVEKPQPKQIVDGRNK